MLPARKGNGGRGTPIATVFPCCWSLSCFTPFDGIVYFYAQAPSTLESDDSFATGKRDRVGTRAEKEFTKLFESWLNSTTCVLRAAIFGDDTVSFCYRKGYIARMMGAV